MRQRTGDNILRSRGRQMVAAAFSIEVSRQPGEVVLAVTGEIDMATGPRLWDAIEAAMRDGDGERIVIDLSATSFMDSTGLGLVIRASGRYGPDRVAVRSPQPRVLALFDLTGMRQHITIDGDPDDPTMGAEAT